MKEDFKFEAILGHSKTLSPKSHNNNNNNNNNKVAKHN
jgi:hypothetical protein